MIIPPNAAMKGAAMVIMQESPRITIEIHDLNLEEDLLTNDNVHRKILNNCIKYEENNKNSFLLAYRNGYEWRHSYGKYSVNSNENLLLKDNGIYLMTGGLGGIAKICCEIIAKTVKNPTLILFTRRSIPDETKWEHIINV